MSKTEPLDLARQLRESIYGMGKNAEQFDLGAAADLIESQHAEVERLRAVEKRLLEAVRLLVLARAEAAEAGGHICGSSCPKYDEVESK